MFGKKKSPDEMMKDWMASLKKEQRGIDGDIRRIERDQNKIKMQIKASAKKGDMNGAKIMAKAVARSNKTIERLYMTKSQINSVAMQLKEQQGMLKVAGAMQTSTAVLAGMSKLMSLPQIAATTRQMAQEMQKAGLITEMMDDMFETMEPEDMEDEAEEAVNQVLEEILAGKFGGLTAPTTQKAPAQVEEEVDDTKESDALQRRLADLG